MPIPSLCLGRPQLPYVPKFRCSGQWNKDPDVLAIGGTESCTHEVSGPDGTGGGPDRRQIGPQRRGLGTQTSGNTVPPSAPSPLFALSCCCVPFALFTALPLGGASLAQTANGWKAWHSWSWACTMGPEVGSLVIATRTKAAGRRMSAGPSCRISSSCRRRPRSML